MLTTLTSPHRLVCLAALGSVLLLPLNAAAQGAGTAAPVASPAPAAASAAAPIAASPNAEVVAACERSVRELLATKGSSMLEVKFNGAPALQRRMSNDEQMVLRGGGSWRRNGGPRTFDYTCNADPRTSEAVGMVMRDTTPASGKGEPVGSALEPDLSFLSPAVCESTIAATLKKRWPRVSDISFESATRTLKQTTPSTAELHGRGRALAEPGAPHKLFGFDCVFDTRDGRLLGSKLSS
jgi:hypothetical protein